MIRAFSALAIGLALAACGGSGEPARAPEPDNYTGENFQAAVLKLDDRQRNVTFIRAIIDAGVPCQGVRESVRIRDLDGKPTWAATCMDGSRHNITVAVDGTLVVRSPTRR